MKNAFTTYTLYTTQMKIKRNSNVHVQLHCGCFDKGFRRLFETVSGVWLTVSNQHGLETVSGLQN